jgi:hypothetical protein
MNLLKEGLDKSIAKGLGDKERGLALWLEVERCFLEGDGKWLEEWVGGRGGRVGWGDPN